MTWLSIEARGSVVNQVFFSSSSWRFGNKKNKFLTNELICIEILAKEGS